MGIRIAEYSIPCDKFMLVTSKHFFVPPQNPPNAQKNYYTDEVSLCLKYTFSKYVKIVNFKVMMTQ